MTELSGLANLGNTCFINSCLQILGNTTELTHTLNKKMEENKIKNNNDGIFLREWIELRDLMWRQNETIAPRKFVKCLHQLAQIKQNNCFINYSQNDVYELLLFLLDSFHNAISRKIKINISGQVLNNVDKMAVKCYKMLKAEYENNYSELNDLFHCVSITTIYSLNNKSILSTKFEINSILHLNIPTSKQKSITLYDCFKDYIYDELLNNDNAYYFEDEDRKMDAIKRTEFWSFPKILIICLKRFNFMHGVNKINTFVECPFELNLSNLVKGYNQSKYCYELYGVCDHIGNGHGGHYTSNIKKTAEKWYKYDDEKVKPILSSQVITANAYCLFYRKFEA